MSAPTTAPAAPAPAPHYPSGRSRTIGLVVAAAVLIVMCAASLAIGTQNVSLSTVWQALTDYGAALGLAFQVVDDILDVTQASDKLGKTAGKDLDNNKPTYVSVLGLERARAHALELRAQAHAALARSGLADTSALALLADKVVERDN